MGAIAAIIGDSFSSADEYKVYDQGDTSAIKIPIYTISGAAYGDVTAVIQGSATISEGIAVDMMPGKPAVIPWR